jgi:hypothetical protein
MAKGMQKYEALYMVTVFQGSNIVSNSLSALIILQEMDGAPWWKLLGYIGCIVVMIGALWFLVSGEEAVCPSNELDDDLRRILSMEEGTQNGEEEQREESESDSSCCSPSVLRYFFHGKDASQLVWQC